MLTRYISSALFNPRLLATTSSRLFSTSASKLGDGDHTKSKAKDKASDDLKSGREKRWLDTVASDSGMNITFSIDVSTFLYCRGGC